MLEQTFPEVEQKDGLGSWTNKHLHVVTDEQYTTPGQVLIGLSYYGNYQNISLASDTSVAFARAVLAAAGVRLVEGRERMPDGTLWLGRG